MSPLFPILSQALMEPLGLRIESSDRRKTIASLSNLKYQNPQFQCLSIYPCPVNETHVLIVNRGQPPEPSDATP